MRGAYSRLNQAKARIAQRTALGQWGTVAGDDDVREVPVEDLEPLSRGIDELDRRHRKGIADFTQKLPSQVWQVGEALGSDAIAVTDEALSSLLSLAECVPCPLCRPMRRYGSCCTA